MLDGDPFQALWYAWTFPDFGDDLTKVLTAYREQVAGGHMRFSDAYILLLANEEQLRHRKTSDTRRSRRNFEKHLRLMTTLPQYFGVLAELLPGRVHTVEVLAVESNCRKMLELTSNLPTDSINHLAVFNQMANWLRASSPELQVKVTS